MGDMFDVTGRKQSDKVTNQNIPQDNQFCMLALRLGVLYVEGSSVGVLTVYSLC